MRYRDSIAVAALLAWGTGLCVWLWGRTGDLVGDYGNELYVAWQLSRGRVLFRDQAYTYGPLSPWINAIWMRLLGPRPDVILAANLAVLCGITLLLYRLLRRLSSPKAARAAIAFFLPIFAFSAGTRITNYNYLTPYAHGMTHGLLLCLAAAECVIYFNKSLRARWAALAGLMTGMAFLTKPEMFLACAATSWLGILAALWMRRPGKPLAPVTAMAAAMLAAPACAWLILRAAMPAGAATQGLLGGWQFVNAPFVVQSPFYRGGLGIDDVSHSLNMLALTTGIDAAPLILLIALALLTPRGIGSIAMAAAAGIGLCALVVWAGQADPAYWIDADRPLILFALAALVVAGWRIFKAAPDKTLPAAAGRDSLLADWLLAVLSVCLLAKMLLNVRTFHYGFVLAAPAALLAVVGLIHRLPAVIAKWGGCASIVGVGAAGILAGLIVNRLALSAVVLGERTLAIPLAMGGRLYARQEDQPAAQAIVWLTQRPISSVAVIPDAAGINYAAARANPVPYDVLSPLTISMWGQEKILAALQADPPEVILLMRADTGSLGGRWFGQDYAQSIFAWMSGRYEPAGAFGPPAYLRSIQPWLRKQ
jgi:4-amino-4-deoxy-L-arabinose transferase-like glycosyltransferase